MQSKALVLKQQDPILAAFIPTCLKDGSVPFLSQSAQQGVNGTGLALAAGLSRPVNVERHDAVGQHLVRASTFGGLSSDPELLTRSIALLSDRADVVHLSVGFHADQFYGY